MPDLFPDIQECPRCEGLIPREHFAQIVCPDGRLITYMYCAHCDWGRETLWEPVHDHCWCASLSVDYDATTDARKLGAFQQRLRDLAADAA